MKLMRSFACLMFTGYLIFSSGCAPEEGLVRYTVSGTVTMPDGKPAPAGDISFEPDGAGGNQGPGSTTQIKDGKFALTKDQGIVGGKYVVIITPFDGIANPDSMMGRALLKLPYSTKVDFPKENTTKDFKIPKL